jgi:hypothetical protein
MARNHREKPVVTSLASSSASRNAAAHGNSSATERSKMRSSALRVISPPGPSRFVTTAHSTVVNASSIRRALQADGTVGDTTSTPADARSSTSAERSSTGASTNTRSNTPFTASMAVAPCPLS